ncbi:organomercurial lyase [Thioalkalivibrio sp. ALMg11]|uniref:organomercurial lyase n=1 Tax=Thioalkalivibrio sp. ALMg11 TaxID=1158165 RepID=UPI000373A5DF|nr:organomercurial lyase [Thioalkalivibrio sp. ALMg11]
MSPARVDPALERLRGDFPLEQRLRNAPEAVRAAYLEVLEHWRLHGQPPEARGLDIHALEQLATLDAVTHQALGLGCYPYSAAPGSITVSVAGGSPVAAMCAVDALAIPMLSGAHSRIEAACSHCGEALSLESGPGGVADTATIRVHYRPRRADNTPCCTSLCDGITFVCAHCAPAEHADYLRLDEADTVARQFFAFQRTWLDANPRSARSG